MCETILQDLAAGMLFSWSVFLNDVTDGNPYSGNGKLEDYQLALFQVRWTFSFAPCVF
jgi:hypothetical protein